MGLHNALLDYLSSIREDLGTGITLNKFQQRAFNIRTENDCLFFEMERHSAALGATYRPGTPMTVYTTRHELYRFCPADNSITIIESTDLGINWEGIDFSQLAEDFLFDTSFTFSKVSDGYIVNESCSCFEMKVKDENDFDSLLKIFLREFEYQSIFYGCDDEKIDSAKKKEVLAELYAACRELAHEKLIDAWDDREE